MPTVKVQIASGDVNVRWVGEENEITGEREGGRERKRRRERERDRGKNVMRIQSEKSCERNHQNKKTCFEFLAPKQKFRSNLESRSKTKTNEKTRFNFVYKRFWKQLRFGGSKVFSQDES